MIKIASEFSPRIGLRKVRKKRKVDLEDFGQLSMFDHASSKVVPMELSRNYFEQAISNDENHNMELARELYLKAINNGQFKDDAYCNLGILKTGQGDIPAAIDMFSKSLKENARHLESHFNLGNIYSEMGNMGLAKLHYETAILIDPDFGDSFYNLALIQIQEKDYEAAIRSLLKYKQLVSAESKICDDIIDDLRNLM